MERNNKGITLIALIVTIIVLIIIAGISIATLTADNGILRQTNAAKVSQLEGTAREQVKLACSAVRLAVAEAQAKDNSYSAKVNSSAIQETIINLLNADKKDLTGNFSNGGTPAGDDQEEITIVYVGDDYTNATNNTSAKITYTIGLSQKTVELKDEENVTLKDQHGNDVVLDIGSNEGTGSGSGSGEGSGEGSGDGDGTGSDTGTTNAYLVDVVEIGDYVDIGISYTNQMRFSSGSTIAKGGLKGWRVLSKSGTGASGTVTLVSAGTPIKYYHGSSASTSLSNINNFNKEIKMEGSLTAGGSVIVGFSGNGLSSNNLSTVWSSNSRINTLAGVHALTTSEVEKTYKTLTGTDYTVVYESGVSRMQTEKMQTEAEGNGLTWSTKANDLLGIGMRYLLGGTSKNTESLWLVGDGCWVNSSKNIELGIRLVLSLNTGVQIDSENTGDGSSVSSAYTLN